MQPGGTWVLAGFLAVAAIWAASHLGWHKLLAAGWQAWALAALPGLLVLAMALSARAHGVATSTALRRAWPWRVGAGLSGLATMCLTLALWLTWQS